MKLWKMNCIILDFVTILTISVPGYADPNFNNLIQAVLPFKAEIPYRDNFRTVAASSIILKKIVHPDKTVLYVVVPPGLFDHNRLNIQQSEKYVLINGFEFVAESTTGLCWSAETAIFKAVIYRESKTYLPNVYEKLIQEVKQITSWQTGNRYATTNSKYWVIGYDFEGEIWKLVKIKPIFQQVVFDNADIEAIKPNLPQNQPPLIYRFKGNNLRAAATSGNIVVDKNGIVVAVVLDIHKSGKYLEAIPSQAVFECAKAFLESSQISFP